MSLNQLQNITGTFEITGIEKDEFATELARIRAKFKQVFTTWICKNHANFKCTLIFASNSHRPKQHNVDRLSELLS